MKKLLLCFPQASRSRKLRRDSCCHNLNGYGLTFQSLPYVMVEPYVLQALTRAAMEQRTVFMQYHSQHRNALAERKIDVLYLVLNALRHQWNHYLAQKAILPWG